jgi:hypothetical protein
VNRVRTFVVVDGRLLRVSVRGEGRPLLLVMIDRAEHCAAVIAEFLERGRCGAAFG